MLHSTLNLTRRTVYHRLSPRLLNGFPRMISPLQVRTFSEGSHCPKAIHEDVSKMRSDLSKFSNYYAFSMRLNRKKLASSMRPKRKKIGSRVRPNGKRQNASLILLASSSVSVYVVRNPYLLLLVNIWEVLTKLLVGRIVCDSAHYLINIAVSLKEGAIQWYLVMLKSEG